MRRALRVSPGGWRGRGAAPRASSACSSAPSAGRERVGRRARRWWRRAGVHSRLQHAPWAQALPARIAGSSACRTRRRRCCTCWVATQQHVRAGAARQTLRGASPRAAAALWYMNHCAPKNAASSAPMMPTIASVGSLLENMGKGVARQAWRAAQTEPRAPRCHACAPRIDPCGLQHGNQSYGLTWPRSLCDCGGARRRRPTDQLLGPPWRLGQ